MRVDKVIARAALSTVAAILLLCAMMIATLCLAFPQTVMKLTYDLGMDGASVKFATIAYERSENNVYYIAYATEVAIGAEDYENVRSCGKTFVQDKEAFTPASPGPGGGRGFLSARLGQTLLPPCTSRCPTGASFFVVCAAAGSSPTTPSHFRLILTARRIMGLTFMREGRILARV